MATTTKIYEKELLSTVTQEGTSVSVEKSKFKYIKRRLISKIITKVRDLIFPLLPIPYRLPWGGWMLLGTCEIARGILYGTYNEQNEINIMKGLLKPGMTVFDLGAYQGLFTIVAAKTVGDEGRVYAFEPVPNQYRILEMNCRLNRLGNVITECMAVSGQKGVTKFFEVDSEQACYSGFRKPAKDVRTSVKEIFVRMTDLDSYLVERGINKVDFIKIDVEGGERDVIEGTLSLWSSAFPPIVLMEVNDKRTGCWDYNASDLLKRFRDWEYCFLQPTNQGLIYHEIQERYNFTNILLVPKNRMDEVRHLT